MNQTTNTEIAQFYDSFSEHLVACYVKGNPRIDAAVKYAVAKIPGSATKVLEVGCGIGETTSRLCRSREGIVATGIDISPQNIETAKRLFGGEANARFMVSDMTIPVEGGPFDVVTLLDVYEHIPPHARPAFHQNLARAMNTTSRLVVTCPSFLHQQFLRENHPEGLQIVDETIGPDELCQLARDLGGVLSDFSYVSVWRTNDYLHATIDRNLQLIKLPKPAGLQKTIAKWRRKIQRLPFAGPASRKRHVESIVGKKIA